MLFIVSRLPSVPGRHLWLFSGEPCGIEHSGFFCSRVQPVRVQPVQLWAAPFAVDDRQGIEVLSALASNLVLCFQRCAWIAGVDIKQGLEHRGAKSR